MRRPTSLSDLFLNFSEEDRREFMLDVAQKATEQQLEIMGKTRQMKKPTLRLFADYCVLHPLWDHHENDKQYIDGSDQQLYTYGVSEYTMHLMKAACYVHDNSPYDKPWEKEEQTTYQYLIKLAKERLDSEIGDKFNIEIWW